MSKINRDTHNRIANTDSERQRIEKELQRQRMMAISGLKPISSGTPQKSPPHTGQTRVIRSTNEGSSLKSDSGVYVPEDSPGIMAEKKTIIKQKRKIAAPPQETEQAPGETETQDIPETDVTSTLNSFKYPKETIVPEETRIGLKEESFKAKDKVFEGSAPKIPMVTTHTKDSALISTDLKRKKTPQEEDMAGHDEIHVEPVEDSPEKSPKLRRRILKKNDADGK
jgi:hypothetical protein